MKLSGYEERALAEIEAWEKKGHTGFHKKVLDVASRPVDFVIKKNGPEKFKAVEVAVTATIDRLLTVSTYTVEPAELIKRAHSHGIMIKDIAELQTCDLDVLDKCNRKNISFHQRAAATQGAVLGLGGGFAATTDITAVLIQAFHLIQEIAFCHGFDPNDTVEKQIILRIIEGALGGSDVKWKTLEEIESLKLAKAEAKEEISKKGVYVLGSKVLEEVGEHLAVSLLIRLIPRALPVVSVVVSAHSNHEIMEHSGNMAFMVYRKRFIKRKREL